MTLPVAVFAVTGWFLYVVNPSIVLVAVSGVLTWLLIIRRRGAFA